MWVLWYNGKRYGEPMSRMEALRHFSRLKHVCIGLQLRYIRLKPRFSREEQWKSVMEKWAAADAHTG
ncbi:hypothetical protein [Paenibacillus flagellatus]|uniref:Uncharacterized protein n=1 Tax=Paenibacillus flagellatus TaxID=2211139 RepID=A0A2V5K7F7_9BACL|nr:hypothetical protein [Paenibacillus flagellatus]PYI53924.1 hypothetical protein DLM86_15330 [Paenibacillus flagellatus]